MVFLSLSLNQDTMLTKSDKSKLRSPIYRYLEGIATSSTTYRLYKKGVLDNILKHKKVALNDLAKLRINHLKGKS